MIFFSVQQAYEAHQKLLKELNAQSGRKRKPEDGSGYVFDMQFTGLDKYKYSYIFAVA